MKQYNYKVVGVTFAARDGSDRQTTLKQLFEEDLGTDDFARTHDIKFEGYDYHGKDALAVFVDGKEIGNIAADKVQEVAEIAQKASKCTVTLGVNGHDLEDYEYIVDRYKNKNDWKESDPFFDADEVKEEYDALMEDLREEKTYHAVLHFFVEGEEDIKPDEIKAENANMQPKKKPSKGYFTFMIIICAVLVIMGLLLALAKPAIGILFAAAGVGGIVYARKGLKSLQEKEN